MHHTTTRRANVGAKHKTSDCSTTTKEFSTHSSQEIALGTPTPGATPPISLDSLTFEQWQAKQIDLPIPFGIEQFRCTQHDTSGSCTAYCTALPIDEIVLFYQQEMERLGWQEIMCVKGRGEYCLTYKKPHKQAVVIVRTNRKRFGAQIGLYWGNLG